MVHSATLLDPKWSFYGKVVPQDYNSVHYDSASVRRIQFAQAHQRIGIPLDPSRLVKLDFPDLELELGRYGATETITIKWPGCPNVDVYIDGGRYTLSRLANELVQQFRSVRHTLQSTCTEKGWKLRPGDQLWLIELLHEDNMPWQAILSRDSP